MSYFIDSSGRDSLELAPGARTRTFWGDQMLFSLVEVDANSRLWHSTYSVLFGKNLSTDRLNISRG